MFGLLAILLLPSEQVVIDYKWLGDTRCATWPISEEPGTWNKAPRVNYVLGLIAGVASERERNLLRDVDADQVSAWMDRWCSEHPLDSTVTGAYELIRELDIRAR